MFFRCRSSRNYFYLSTQNSRQLGITMATELDKVIDEKETAVFSGTLQASSTAVIPVANIATATLTLYNQADGAIINSRNAQNILGGAGNVTMDSLGILTWNIQSLDNVIIDTAASIEKHVAMFEITTVGTTPVETFKDEFIIKVRNLT